MRKLILIPVIILTLILTSCEKSPAMGELLAYQNEDFSMTLRITDGEVFGAKLMREASTLTLVLTGKAEAEGITFPNMNFGGGLGIDYHHPNHINIPDFENYFAVFNRLVNRREGQNIHFELGRAVVGQCGNLISRVLYVKEGEVKRFAILDAGFTELIRPAMYDAYHRIENLSSNNAEKEYDVVGPICESSDVFGKNVMLNEVKRGDIIALRSAGAYGEVMSSQYNLRNLPNSYFSEDFE